MTYVIDRTPVSETSQALRLRRASGALSNATTNVLPVNRLVRSAVAISAIASVALPLPAVAARSKFEGLEHGVHVAEDEPLPSNDLIEECFVYRSSTAINSSIVESSGVLYKLYDGKITIRQHRSEKRTNVTTDTQSPSNAGRPALVRQPRVMSAGTTGIVRGFIDDFHIANDLVDVVGDEDPVIKQIERIPDHNLNKDARAFAGKLRDISWRPDVWFDDAEIVFEWIDDYRHAVVSIEGDGHLGYTLLIDGQFQSGKQGGASVTTLPDDLKEYLTKAA